MRKTRLQALIVSALLAAAAATVFGAESVGTLVSLRGTATATDSGGTVRTLALKSPVFQNDKIETTAGASLQIMFLDESIISQGEKSEMTIDEYVYNPGKTEENSCVLSLGKGLFRAVTAKITALNPDRFKIQTRRSVIGIRGCEVAFNITEREDNIYVLSLPDGKSIVITLNEGADVSALTAGGTVDKENAIHIIQAGILVRIEEDGGVTQRPMTPQEAIDLIEEIAAPPAPPTGGLPPNNVTDSTNQENNQGDLEEEEQAVIEQLTPPPPEEEEEPVPVLEFVEQSNGIGWKWGIWQYPGLPPEKVDFFVQDPYIQLTGAEVLTFVSLNSGSGFNMTGSGETAAIVRDGGSQYLLSGECGVSFNVSVGGATSWSAETQAFGSPMPISDGVHSLYYMINGTVDGSGILQGVFSAYNLIVGPSFDDGTIQSFSIKADLTGPDALTVEGMVGRFDVIHANGPTVQGGFGASQGVF